MFLKIYLTWCVAVVVFGIITWIKTRIEYSSPFMKSNYKKIWFRRNIFWMYLKEEDYNFRADLIWHIINTFIFTPLFSWIYFFVLIILKLKEKKLKKEIPQSKLERIKELNYKIKYSVLTKEEMESIRKELREWWIFHEYEKLEKESEEYPETITNDTDIDESEDEDIEEYEYIIRDKDNDWIYEHEEIRIQPTKKRYILEHHCSDIWWDSTYEYKIQGTNVLHKCTEEYEYQRARYYPEWEIWCKMIQNNKVMKWNIIEYVNTIKKSWDDNYHEGTSIIEDNINETDKRIEECQKVCKWHEEWNISVNCFILSKELSTEEFKNYLISEIDKIKYTKELIKNHLKGSWRELKYLEWFESRDIVTVDHNKEFTSRDEILWEIEEYCNSHWWDFSTRRTDASEYEKFLNNEKEINA